MKEANERRPSDNPLNSERQVRERHSGIGSESAMKQLKVWERRRAEERAAAARDRPAAQP